MNILDLEGKVALVTGAGQGVGRQVAIHLAAHGAKGVIVNDFVEERALSTAAEINREIGEDRALGLQADVTDFDSVMAMAEQGRNRFGAIDILVNNAGNAGADPSNLSGKPFWQQEPKNWKPWVDVNLNGVLNCCRACLPDMVENKSGSVVNIISDAGRMGEANMDVYSAAKAGAAGFTRAIARSLGRHTVRANCVSISGTYTPTTEQILRTEQMQKALSGYVIRRFGEPQDVANMVLFLASDAASWVTGQTYPVNGGFNFAL